MELNEIKALDIDSILYYTNPSVFATALAAQANEIYKLMKTIGIPYNELKGVYLINYFELFKNKQLRWKMTLNLLRL